MLWPPLGRTLWVTDLSQYATRLPAPGRGRGVTGTGAKQEQEQQEQEQQEQEQEQELVIPAKLAIAFGTELRGATPELLAAADRRVYLPLHGFADSLNLSVATASGSRLALCIVGFVVSHGQHRGGHVSTL